jgi:hypothetical protein
MKIRNKLLLLVLVVFTVLPSSFLVLAKPDELKLTVIELKMDEKGGNIVYAIPSTDDALTNPDRALLGYHWYATANYYVNPVNKYGFSQTAVVTAITTSANTWDKETSYQVFSYKSTTTRSAGKYDGYNVVAWGKYRKGVIGVTYLWSISGRVIETDTMLNNLYSWSLSGASGKMDVQNIMTHEFGHWCGLADLYDSKDYYLTMYGYSGYGITYQRDLGLGDIIGLREVYGS